MAWKEMFDEKFMTAEEAAKMINSGDVVWVGALTSGAPQVVDAVTDRYEELENVRLIGDFSLTEYKCFNINVLRAVSIKDMYPMIHYFSVHTRELI